MQQEFSAGANRYLAWLCKHPGAIPLEACTAVGYSRPFRVEDGCWDGDVPLVSETLVELTGTWEVALVLRYVRTHLWLSTRLQGDSGRHSCTSSP